MEKYKGGTINTEGLLSDVHHDLPPPPAGHGDGEAVRMQQMLQGSYLYYHYNCDGFDDRGWGCGYRTLQTMCSWVTSSLRPQRCAPVPTVCEIQRLLVKMQDKSASFCGSREWIGSVEASHVLGSLYDVECRLVHVSTGSDLSNRLELVSEHLARGGGPVMVGGDLDASAKAVVGVHGRYLLVVDPHFYGTAKDKRKLQSEGWVRWNAVEDFSDMSFYNLCMPLAPIK